MLMLERIFNREFLKSLRKILRGKLECKKIRMQWHNNIINWLIQTIYFLIKYDLFEKNHKALTESFSDWKLIFLKFEIGRRRFEITYQIVHNTLLRNHLFKEIFISIDFQINSEVNSLIKFHAKICSNPFFTGK